MLTSRYPERMEHVASISGIVTGVKTIAYLLTAVTLALLALRRRRRELSVTYE